MELGADMNDRTCIVTRQSGPADRMIRFVADPEAGRFRNLLSSLLKRFVANSDRDARRLAGWFNDYPLGELNGLLGGAGWSVETHQEAGNLHFFVCRRM